MEERNRQYRSLKMQAVGAWLLAVPLLLLSIFGNYVSYGSEIQLPLAALALLFLGTSFYTDAWKRLREGRATMDTLIAFSASVAFLFSLFNTFFPDYWHDAGLQPHVYYEVTVLIVAVGLTGKVFRFLPEELHGEDRIANIIFPVLTGTGGCRVFYLDLVRRCGSRAACALFGYFHFHCRLSVRVGFDNTRRADARDRQSRRYAYLDKGFPRFGTAEQGRCGGL